MHPEGVAEIHGGCGTAVAVGAEGEVHVVDAALPLQKEGDRPGVLHGSSSGNVFLGGDADSQGKSPAGPGADFRDDLAQKAQAVAQGTSVAVGSPVGVAGEKLRHQIAVSGMDLHAVESCPFRPDRGIAEAGDEPSDVPSRGISRRTGQGIGDGAEGRMPPVVCDVVCRPAWRSWAKVLLPCL